MNQQINLPLSKVAKYELEDFIISSSNQEAYQLLNDWHKEWGVLPFPHSLILTGPTSSGKTHLAKIWQKNSASYEILNYQIPSEETLENYSAFILEDIEKGAEEDVLHIFNLVNERKKYLLLTTSDLHFNLPDLSSRINSLRQIKISQPDDELFKILLFKNFSSKSVNIPANIIDYLAARLPRRFDIAINIVEKIDDFALAHNRKITVPLLKEILG